MKKAYETPKAVMYVFNYQDNVVASNTDDEGNIKDGKTGHAANACGTHNASDVYEHGCTYIPKN